MNQHPQKVLNQSPYAEYQAVELSHGLGMGAHELPFIGKDKNLAIKKSCVITLERELQEL